MRGLVALGGVLLLTLATVGPVAPPTVGPGPSHASLALAGRGPVPTGPAPTPVEPRLHPLAGGQGRLIVNTTDRSSVPNTGIETNLTDYLTLGLPPDSSFQTAVEEVIGDHDAVFGLFQNSVTFPEAFFSVFSNSTDATEHIAYWTNLTLTPGTSYRFALTATNGTHWTLTVNGGLFGDNRSDAEFDFGATEATWAGGIGFSEVALYSGPFITPSEIDVPVAFATRTGSGWYLPTEAAAYLFTNGERWGAAGRLQDSLLAPGEIETGTAVANLTDGTALWTGGPVPVIVALDVAVTQAPGMYPVVLQLSVVSTGGTLLPNVALALADSARGGFTPAAVLTGSNGGASSVLSTPNVTEVINDSLQAQVTLLGFVGSASVALEIVPAKQLFLTLSPNPAEVVSGATVNLVVGVTAGNGAAAEGILLLVGVAGGVASYSPFITSDVAGHALITLSTSTGAPTLQVTVIVVAPGYWGHGNFSVNVQPPPPTFWEKFGLWVDLGVVGAIAVVGYVVLRRERRRRRPIPHLGTILDPPKAPVSRRPP